MAHWDQHQHRIEQTDRYDVSGPHVRAALTLSTPLDTDNADASHRIAHSFRFR